MRVLEKHKLLIIILLVASFLRLYALGRVPVSLFGDELDVGYHAYSILKTGKDYSGNSWPLHFQSLAEYRTPLYIYSVVPTVALFGISPLGVRLPAAIFGIISIWGLYLLVKEFSKNEKLALISAAVLTLPPWHIQYSRAAFEVTLMLALLLFGLYIFFRALKEGKYLWISTALLTLTPLVYSTAKLFAPALVLFLFLVWRKEVFAMSKKYLLWALFVGIIVGAPTVYSTLFGGGTQRFGYISVFTDPTVATDIDAARLMDAHVRGAKGLGLQPDIQDRLMHNKGASWIEVISKNILKAYSFDFLFISGDPNLRHSINGVGQFFYIETIALVVGLILFFSKYKERRVKWLIGFWLLFGVLPSAITRIGGNHATRLILILPPLVFLIAYGLVAGFEALKHNPRRIFALAYIFIFITELVYYQHYYWVHNPWDSERWWHSGFKESFSAVDKASDDYSRIFLSMAGEPVWIFFAGWNQYPPKSWHEGFPFEKIDVDGFGEISFIDKYFFGSPNEEGGIYSLKDFMRSDDLYLAVAKEVGWNLIKEPSRVPIGLELLKAIPYPSGEPAYYLFAKAK